MFISIYCSIKSAYVHSQLYGVQSIQENFIMELRKFSKPQTVQPLNILVHIYLYLLQKIRKSKVGTICNDFVNFENMEIIGKGAFGVVYLYTTTSGEKLAIKKENKVHSYLCNIYIYIYIYIYIHIHIHIHIYISYICDLLCENRPLHLVF